MSNKTAITEFIWTIEKDICTPIAQGRVPYGKIQEMFQKYGEWDKIKDTLEGAIGDVEYWEEEFCRIEREYNDQGDDLRELKKEVSNIADDMDMIELPEEKQNEMGKLISKLMKLV